MATTTKWFGSATTNQFSLPSTTWNGGSVSLPQATITVVSTTGFPGAGRIVIDTTPNVMVTYTGKSGTTFTGCTVPTSTAQAITNANKVYGFDQMFDWKSQPIKVALYTGSVPSAANQDTWVYRSDVTNSEVTSSGYVAGGLTLTTPTVTYDTASNETRLDADDASWTAVTFAPTVAIVYRSTGTAGNDPLIAYIDLGGAQSVTGANFTLQWDTTGVVKAVTS